jgi:hypothetical protein
MSPARQFDRSIDRSQRHFHRRLLGFEFREPAVEQRREERSVPIHGCLAVTSESRQTVGGAESGLRPRQEHVSRALVEPQAAFFRDIQYDVGPCQRRLGVAARHFVHRLEQKIIRDGGHVFGSERLGQRCF